MDKRPIVSDLEAEDIATLTTPEGREVVAARLRTSVDRIASLITTNPDAIDAIHAAQAEMEAWGRLRAAMMVPDALDTMAGIMAQKYNEKKAMAAEKAAEAIMDRSYLPRQSARFIQEKRRGPDKNRVLPTVGELVDMAETDTEALDLIKRHREVVKEVEALRRGAKEIIDVQPEKREK